jgi:hypothetical protein
MSLVKQTLRENAGRMIFPITALLAKTENDA